MRFLPRLCYSILGPIALLAATGPPVGCEVQVLDPLPLDHLGGSGTAAAGGAGCGTAGSSAGGSDGGSCSEDGGEEATCPASPPADRSPCRDIRGDCEYDETTCDCHDQAWVCWDLSDCPEDRPAGDSDCPRVGIECDYGQWRCECESQGWDCYDSTS
jgi:hypothetical protein